MGRRINNQTNDSSECQFDVLQNDNIGTAEDDDNYDDSEDSTNDDDAEDNTDDDAEDSTDDDAEDNNQDEREQEEEPDVHGQNLAGDVGDSGDEGNFPVMEPENVENIGKNLLRNTFLQANLTHTQGNLVLKTLRQFPFNHDYLPKDQRTLLRTPTIIASTLVQPIAGGEYLHIGFRSTLLKKLESLPPNTLPEIIEIDFSTDGAQLHHSGGYQFWPIQYRIFNIKDTRPVIAGIFKGKQKPTNAFDFFETFIAEIMDIRAEHGIVIHNTRIPVHIRCFIADAPARAFALNHYGHMSTNPCSKCKIEGQRCDTTNRMVYLGINYTLRTDENYANMIDEDHHKGRSALEPLLGLVSQVPFDSMHLVYLGIVKKILSAQIEGKFRHRRLNNRKLEILDGRMTGLEKYCPSEFNRRPQKLTAFKQFKATEYRQFLLYSAPAVTHNVLEEHEYEHLLLLHCIIRILQFQNITDDYYTFCQSGIECFVSMCEQLYGQQFCSYNVHALLHIVADVKRLGTLDSYSSFCYENNLREFKKYIRKPHLPLQQYYKRLCERNNVNLLPKANHPVIRTSKSHSEGPIPDDLPDGSQQFHKLEVSEIRFTNSLRDNCFLHENNHIYIIKNIIRTQEQIYLIANQFKSISVMYDVGFTSEFVGVYDCSNLSEEFEKVSLNQVKQKCYRMPKWSNRLGEEERELNGQWICVTLLMPFVLP